MLQIIFNCILLSCGVLLAKKFCCLNAKTLSYTKMLNSKFRTQRSFRVKYQPHIWQRRPRKNFRMDKIILLTALTGDTHTVVLEEAQHATTSKSANYGIWHRLSHMSNLVCICYCTISFNYYALCWVFYILGMCSSCHQNGPFQYCYMQDLFNGLGHLLSLFITYIQASLTQRVFCDS